jgi:hypothetical protein
VFLGPVSFGNGSPGVSNIESMLIATICSI